MPITETRFGGVFTDGNLLLTRNAVPGNRVYGERLFNHRGTEYREWVPNRSKLQHTSSAAVRLPFKEDSKVSIPGSGLRYDVLARRRPGLPGRDLLRGYQALVPGPGQALRDPEEHDPILARTPPSRTSTPFAGESPTVVYQDIAQKNQVGIFIKNMRASTSSRHR